MIVENWRIIPSGWSSTLKIAVQVPCCLLPAFTLVALQRLAGMQIKANVVRKMSLTDETGKILIECEGPHSSCTRRRIRRAYYPSSAQSRSAALQIVCPPRHQRLQYKVVVVSGIVSS
jgi:hypothetical protein